MQITGMLQIRATVGEAAMVERLDEEIARVQALSDEAVEALSTLIGAHDPLDVVRKLYRFVAALASPGPVLARVFERDPDALPGFCLNLAACRAYLERLGRGVDPVEAAREVELGRRVWLAREMREHRVSSEEDWTRDVFDAKGELDAAAVQAEIARLLRRLGVAPELVEVTVRPGVRMEDEDGGEGEPPTG